MDFYANNIKGLRKMLGFSQQQFAELVGATRAALAQYEAGNNQPKTKVALRICKIANISHKELFEKDLDFARLNLMDVQGLDAEKLDALINGTPPPNIPQRDGSPYFDIDATASNINVFGDVQEIPAAYITVPSFKDCDFYLNVYGDSMYPKYSSGEIIACKKITDLDIIPYGEAFLIITSEQRLIKYIRKGNRADTVLLVSENPKFEPFEIKRKAILHLYKVVGKIRRDVP